MNILITAATSFELKPFLTKISVGYGDINPIKNIQYNNLSIDILICGIGLAHTSYHLTKALNCKKYHLVINAGIAGSFNRELQLGEVVLVELEEFGDLGIENENGFETVFDSGLVKKNDFPFKNGKLEWCIPDFLKIDDIKKVKGFTSNTAHGNEKHIDKLLNIFEADIETMEGAAFFYVCLMEKVNFIQLRSISNYVETRNTSKWNIPLALDNLTDELFQLIKQLNSRII